MSANLSIILVTGATASGKSDFAQDLALQCNGEIINADSQQFYQGFEIGTGKVLGPEQKVQHWFLDLCRPGEKMTAVQFTSVADELIAKLCQNEKTAVVVGGTGLYLKGLLEGFDLLPPRNEAIRRELRRRYQNEGGEVLHKDLEVVDPISAAKISQNDPIRLIRYLEIYKITNQAPSLLMKRKRPEFLRYRCQSYWLKPPRQLLREKIAARVKEMLRQGWLHEVEALLQQGLSFAEIQNKPIGYEELSQVLKGKTSLEAATAAIIQKTQQYAKRQETFLRGLFENNAYHQAGNSLKILTDPEDLTNALTHFREDD